MTTLIIIALSSFVALLATLFVQDSRLKKGAAHSNNSVAILSEYSVQTLRYGKGISKYLKKMSAHYSFHFLVRVLYYIRSFFDKLYSVTRNRFMNEVIKDKRAVSFFWDHLKDYKKEMDKEKER